MMKILVTGADGQLGRCLGETTPDHIDAAMFNRLDFNICDESNMIEILDEIKPEVVVNCAAYTDVERAEVEEYEARLVNSVGVGQLARLCKSRRIKVLHISTDFVFAGDSSSPYGTADYCEPLCVYGTTKRQGELELLEHNPDLSWIIRTSWLYSEYGANFVLTMINLFAERDELRIVQNQQGSPTYARGLAELIWHMLYSNAIEPGIYHWCDQGSTNWFEFADKIGDLCLERGLIAKKPRIEPIDSIEFGGRAERPAYSVLECEKLELACSNFERSRWDVHLNRMLDNLVVLKQRS